MFTTVLLECLLGASALWAVLMAQQAAEPQSRWLWSLGLGSICVGAWVGAARYGGLPVDALHDWLILWAKGFGVPLLVAGLYSTLYGRIASEWLVFAVLVVSVTTIMGVAGPVVMLCMVLLAMLAIGRLRSQPAAAGAALAGVVAAAAGDALKPLVPEGAALSAMDVGHIALAITTLGLGYTALYGRRPI